ncbi:MAG: hypothetical protein NTZ56_05960 [Acidobacteria bacterium]|nr:hypothetical protein [Acidobacteriota bacterium]
MESSEVPPEIAAAADERAAARFVTSPLVEAKGPPGPACPDTENPYDRMFD